MQRRRDESEEKEERSRKVQREKGGKTSKTSKELGKAAQVAKGNKVWSDRRTAGALESLMNRSEL